MRPLIGYPGGKTRLAKVILAHAPKHDTYVEGFAGGLSVLFAKPPVKREAVSDMDKQLIGFYKNFRIQGCGQLQSCVAANPPSLKTSKKFTQRFRAGSTKPCDYYMARRLSFGSNGKDVGHTASREGQDLVPKVRNNCEAWRKRLGRVKISHGDFRTTMKQHEGAKTFVYLDPPYLGRAKGLYRFEEVTPVDVCEAARKSRSKVLISYPDSKEVRQACRGLKIKRVPHKYPSRNRNHGKVHRVHELLISNYPLPRGV